MIDMAPQLREDILNEIRSDSKVKQDASGKYLQQIECPTCHKREAFISTDNPWVIKCGREKNCGESHHVKDEYPHLFETWTERYQPETEEERAKNPTAVADGYLRDGRGFDLMKIRGWYTQEYFHHTELNVGSTTVRFKMPNGFWERVLDKPQRFGKQKARMVGATKGIVWVPPGLTIADLAKEKEIWVVEGIFDAIALLHAGIVAVSNISSSNYPDAFLQEIQKACAQGKRPRIIWAQDGDRAGRKAAKKFRNFAEQDRWQCGAALPPADKNYDWNDLHQLGRLEDKDIANYLHNGDLLLAKTAAAKALLMYQQRERSEFWFEFDNELYWWKLDLDKFNKEVNEMRKKDDSSGAEQLSEEDRDQALKNAGAVNKICTAFPRALYFLENSITDETWYFFGVEKPDGSTVKKSFTTKQLTNPGEFTSRLLTTKGAWWTGSPKQLQIIMRDMTSNVKTVETIDYIGYSAKHGAYVFNNEASKDGRVMKANEEEYFQFGKLSVKSLATQPDIDINLNLDNYNKEWTDHLKIAFGTFGIVSVAYWLGALYAEQIRQKQQSYPFFELVGKAGAGKSTLLEFMWKLLGRNAFEGEDPNKQTVAARGRYFANVSNLPIVLIEGDREDVDTIKSKQFDWDEMKPAFNGRSLRSRGVKNSGNETYSPPMRGAIVISQNAKINASEATLSRIVHVFVTDAHHCDSSKDSSDWLANCPMENLSGFTVEAMKNEKQLLELFENAYKHHYSVIVQHKDIRMMRIKHNHAQLLALLECLGPQGLKLFSESDLIPARSYVIDMAKERQQTINKDVPLVQDFWEAYDYIQGYNGKNRLNHAKDPEREIHVNLKEFEHWCAEFKLKTPPVREIKRHLNSSKSRKFLESNKPVNSHLPALNGEKPAKKTIRCWIFLAESY